MHLLHVMGFGVLSVCCCLFGCFFVVVVFLGGGCSVLILLFCRFVFVPFFVLFSPKKFSVCFC